MNTHITPVLSAEELATILAALRYYQQQGLGDPLSRPDEIHWIATNNDTITSLAAEDIDRLCEHLNTVKPMGGLFEELEGKLFLRAYTSKLIEVRAMFPVVDPEGFAEEPANAFMQANPGLGLLAISNRIALLADVGDKGVTEAQLDKLVPPTVAALDTIKAEGFELAAKLRDGVYAKVVGIGPVDSFTSAGASLNERAMGDRGLYATIIEGTALLLDVGTEARERGLVETDPGDLSPNDYLRLLLRPAPAVSVDMPIAPQHVATSPHPTVALTMPLSPQFVGDVLCTMVESGYPWFDWQDEVRENVPESEDVLGWRYTSARAVELDDDGDTMEEGQSRLIDGPAIAEAITQILKGGLCNADAMGGIARAVSENDAGMIDADYADVIAQVAVLGEVRYG